MTVIPPQGSRPPYQDTGQLMNFSSATSGDIIRFGTFILVTDQAENWSTIPPLNIEINTLVEIGSHCTRHQFGIPLSVALIGAVVNPVV